VALLLKELEPSLLCKQLVQLRKLLLKVAALLEVKALSAHTTEATDGKPSAMKAASKNATTTSTSKTLVQVHQEMPSQTKLSLLLENK